MNDFVNAIGLLGEEQAGFRNGYSTINHVLVRHYIVDIYLHERKQLFCTFIDYSKAFDLVDPYPILGAGINGKIIMVIYNLYQNAKSCIKSNGKII